MKSRLIYRCWNVMGWLLLACLVVYVYVHWPRSDAKIKEVTLSIIDVNTTPTGGMAGSLAIRMCTQEERLAHISWYCKNRFEPNMPLYKDPAGRTLIDFRHNMTFCWMSKAGCTSLKAFMLEANGYRLRNESVTDSLNQVHFVETYNIYGLKQVYQLHAEAKRKILDNFYNVFAIRHPFDRLVSYYRDKLVDQDPSSSHRERQGTILRFSRKNLFKINSTLNAMIFPQDDLGPPLFEEFLTWAYEGKVQDEHWNHILEACHPCAHHWDALLRIETMRSDENIFKSRLKMESENIPLRHSHEGDRDYSKFNRHLPIYANVNDGVINYWLDFYRTDMEMFGYQWDKKNMMATCSIKSPDGLCC